MADQNDWMDRDVVLAGPVGRLLDLYYEAGFESFRRRPVKTLIAVLRRWPSVALLLELGDISDKAIDSIMKQKKLRTHMEWMLKKFDEDERCRR